MEITTKIQVSLKDNNKYGSFSDAIYYTLDDYALLSEQDIIDQCQARVDAWMDMMSIPVVATAETLEGLQADKERLENQLAEINQKISEL